MKNSCHLSLCTLNAAARGFKIKLVARAVCLLGLDGPDAGIAHRPPRCALPPGLQDEPAALHTDGSTWLSDPHFALSKRVCVHVLTGAADGGESTWGSGVFHCPAGGGQGAGAVSQGPQPELCSAGWVRWGTFMCRREVLPGGGIGTRHRFAGSCCSSQGFEGRWCPTHAPCPHELGTQPANRQLFVLPPACPPHLVHLAESHLSFEARPECRLSPGPPSVIPPSASPPQRGCFACVSPPPGGASPPSRTICAVSPCHQPRV